MLVGQNIRYLLYVVKNLPPRLLRQPRSPRQPALSLHKHCAIIQFCVVTHRTGTGLGQTESPSPVCDEEGLGDLPQGHGDLLDLPRGHGDLPDLPQGCGGPYFLFL